MTSFFHRKIVLPIIGLLKQGVSPEKIALALAFGIVLGIFPVIGATTVLCLLASLLFRLNPAGIQIVNWLVYPLQILLLIPFYQFGDWLFGASAPLSLSAQELVALFQTDFQAALKLLGDKTLQAVAAWILVFPAVLAALYWTFKALIKRLGPTGRRSAA
jgi:uncharacterized protein (DUF2062 family)